MSPEGSGPDIGLENAIRQRYTEGAKDLQPELCCPTSYDPKYLSAIPEEVLLRDYGCGDPSQHLKSGETVLDLGSGSGKICFIASQVVGPQGRVIGVDMNDEMLNLARRSAPEAACGIGYANVEFRKGKIQDLSLDLELVEAFLRQNPVRSVEELSQLEAEIVRLRSEQPLIADGSVDVVVSNCVLNLVKPEDKQNLFREIFRVLRRGGRAVISDIVCDEEVPERMKKDPELWSGCISGAYREDAFLEAFERAGFYGVTLLSRQPKPWRTVQGIEFRSVTVAAYKGKEGPCFDEKQAVVYRGPFRQVQDDDGHVLRRGVRVAVCAKTFEIYCRDPYKPHFEAVEPLVVVSPDEAEPFPCTKGMLTRHPRETKWMDYDLTTEAQANCCEPGTSEDGKCC